MKKGFVLIALLFVALALAAFAAAPEERYVSEWRTIGPGQTAAFEHGLGVRPLELDVWVASHLKSAADFTDAVPWTDWNGVRPQVQSVNPETVLVLNPADTFVVVQVVASP